MAKKSVFYSLDKIKQYHAKYNVIYGERSNGKTTAVLTEGIEQHVKSGYVEQLAIVRRWEEDFKGTKSQQMFKGHITRGDIEKLTKGKYNSVYYYSQRWYLVKYDDSGNKVDIAKEPFALGFAISSEEHYKSTQYPFITTILFDEFITRNYYLPDEFISFQNLLSTIIRLRTDVTIYMCGNTINRYCPYFEEMGLTNVKNQNRGTIDLYTYGDSGLTVAVEYSDFPTKEKDSNIYFAFNNPKLQMITQGGWEIDIYPHLPIKYKPKECLYKFYIVFDGEILQGNIISVDDDIFIYLHKKTTPIRDDNEQLVYDLCPNYKHNYRININRPYGKIDTLIAKLIARKKVFYQTNEIGEVFRNFLMEQK